MKLIFGSGKVCRSVVKQALKEDSSFWHLGPEYYGAPADSPHFWKCGSTVVDFADWVTTGLSVVNEVVICIPGHAPLPKALFRLPSVYLQACEQYVEWLEVLRLVKFAQGCGFDSIATMFDETSSVQSKCLEVCVNTLLESLLEYKGTLDG
tara:strand:+ start:7048 stop:7500 length:453 start_codon:yes stop_codon:yes gene_type:complete